jgi:hypothetical protein
VARAQPRPCDWRRWLGPPGRSESPKRLVASSKQRRIHPTTALPIPPMTPLLGSQLDHPPAQTTPARPRALQLAAQRSLRHARHASQPGNGSALSSEAGPRSRSSLAPRTSAAPFNRSWWVPPVAHLTLQRAGPDNVLPLCRLQPYSARRPSPGISSGASLRLTASALRLLLRPQQPPRLAWAQGPVTRVTHTLPQRTLGCIPAHGSFPHPHPHPHWPRR